MTFVIITHVKHKFQGQSIFGYAPYVREMNIWLKHVDEVIIVAPKTSEAISKIDIAYQHKNIKFVGIPAIQFTSLKYAFSAIFKLPKIVWAIFKASKKANHLHLRCPGNIGLFGCLVQMVFPKIPKTAKYAGNWDPKSSQPLSYKLQKKILSSTLLTKNMQVLVYGKWPNQTKNIKPFFTATFTENEIEASLIRQYTSGLKFVFLGSLVSGKRPLLAIKIVELLIEKGFNVSFDLYGEGILKEELQLYVEAQGLSEHIKLLGNRDKNVVKEALKEAHFLILPSKSEGWPKALAEAMFFGAIPISTTISCVPYMLDEGNRGILISPDEKSAVNKIESLLNTPTVLQEMSKLASKWSQNYTLNTFETEIVKLLQA
ncbi:glycosyltransferase family 4 protein [Neotamlana laminarinivorans]|uniref:Glycosyltransferase family 4 protein n=1 Tax=Neotamlana laminarinivorans TaxID=2883124 RepID=A0A9X1I3H8_9FLAO|nr:glycosyltransferase [Tamlana laminarinivorans]MCB4799717.1 glycosyltransferase family 4 protein [Tamlana laminarinivorans]